MTHINGIVGCTSGLMVDSTIHHSDSNCDVSHTSHHEVGSGHDSSVTIDSSCGGSCGGGCGSSCGGGCGGG